MERSGAGALSSSRIRFERLELKLEHWPPRDRAAWQASLADGDILDGAGPRAYWSPATRSKCAQSYGVWLAFLAQIGPLDDQEDVASRATREVLKLNGDGISGPRNTPWGASTIYGNWRRGTGVLNNELYAGRLVWNRQRFVKDPETGRRQARPNSPEAWITEDVPDLRIVEEELWDSVKARQKATRSSAVENRDVRSERARRPRYLFSGLVTCGACGGGFILTGARHYGCANNRNRGTCGNRLTIRRDVLEATVLDGLRENLLHPDLIREFVAEYQREWNRLRREEDAAKGAKRKELAQVERQIRNIIEAVREGMFVASMKGELVALEERKAALAEETATPAEEASRLHPGLADIYRAKVAELTNALNEEALKDEAADALRALISEIRMIPQEGRLVIELVGELAAIMGIVSREGKLPEGAPSGVSLSVVAGAGFEPAAFRL